MADIAVETSQYHGSLVAFEGPSDIISTQLRLLPNSPKILILPPIQYFTRENEISSPFDARLQILKTHEACDVRTETARKFLRESTPDNKRLVFMDGGTASAQLTCISAISKYETNGDDIKAEIIFNELIQDGIAGLKRQGTSQLDIGIISKADAATDKDGQGDVVLDDPISKAMRAADALDLETAFLQDTYEPDIITTIRPRSTSVPALPVADGLQNAAPFYIFGPTEGMQTAPLAGAAGQGSLLDVEKWRTMTASEDQLSDPNTIPKSPVAISEPHPYDRLRPTSAVGPSHPIVESMPSSPALLGEAFVVDLRSPVPRAHKRIKSVDQMYATAIRNQDISLCNLPQSTSAKPEEHLFTPNNPQEKETDSPRKPTLRSNFYSEKSYPTFGKPSKTIVRKCLPSPLNLETKGPQQPVPYVSPSLHLGTNLVHQDTPTEPALNTPELGIGNVNSSLYSGDNFELDANEPFQTVLPIVEDLVIHFKGEENYPKLEAMIQAFKQGTYPVSMPPLLLEPKGGMDQLGTPTTVGSRLNSDAGDIRDRQEVIQEPIPIYSPDEYDPYASHGNYLGPPTTSLLKQDLGSQPQKTVTVSNPPTLAQTPPPSINTSLDRVFHDFDIRECKTAVCIQNSLRSILNVYFPSENIGYHQFKFPLLPELSSFWRPVFREIPTGNSKATRKIDLILAIGAQRSVDRGLLGTISGSLEKLGREPNGASRSGRLDLRYLIANTMQAFTSQPLANQTQDNPFTNPLLLATLIVPHLETYIAAHSGTRFLILDYPGEYLSTVLALQHLIGVDLLKVAGIIDAEAGSPKSHRGYTKSVSRTTAPSVVSSTSKGTSAMLLSPKRSRTRLNTAEKTRAPQPSFSKANFILTSTATESEIATLISTIWKILIDISPSYIPENMEGSNWKHKLYNTPPSPPSLFHPKNKDAPFLRAAVMLGFIPSPEDEQHHQTQPPNYVSIGTHTDLPTPIQRPITPAKSFRASAAETFPSSPSIRTPRTPRSAQTQRNKLRHLLGQDPSVFTTSGGAETEEVTLYYDYEDEDDNALFAAEERKYMPLWSNQGGPRKGNSRKALKWLGLST
ncbi:hypothetical protein GGS24DRAFT_457851 [Hypoxylon argillaceum]|nr:hypothetical protein GGS24DRAFT_457851 [Hypoxylon argillaceum]